MLAAALCGATLVAGPAAAATNPHGRILQKPCANLNSDAAIQSSPLGCIPYNTTIAIQCTLAGDQVRGPFGVSRIWDRTTYKGKTGFVTDAEVDTGTNDPVAPSCLGRGKGSILRQPCMRLLSGPSYSTPNLGVCVPYNTVITINCTAQGEAVLGPWGTTKIWDHTTYGGQSGYLSDAWIWTGMAAPTAPPC